MPEFAPVPPSLEPSPRRPWPLLILGAITLGLVVFCGFAGFTLGYQIYEDARTSGVRAREVNRPIRFDGPEKLPASAPGADGWRRHQLAPVHLALDLPGETAKLDNDYDAADDFPFVGFFDYEVVTPKSKVWVFGYRFDQEGRPNLQDVHFEFENENRDEVSYESLFFERKAIEVAGYQGAWMNSLPESKPHIFAFGLVCPPYVVFVTVHSEDRALAHATAGRIRGSLRGTGVAR